LTVRSAERAAREGGAKRRPRRTDPFDPALVDRVTAAAERLTGMPCRAVGGKLQIRFENDAKLAELVEALEAAAG
jgi:hypothetical protein